MPPARALACSPLRAATCQARRASARWATKFIWLHWFPVSRRDASTAFTSTTPATAARAPSSSATDYSRRRRGKGRRKAPFSLRRALDEDQAAARSLLAQLDERRVFRRAVPLQGLFQRRKFKHRDALRRPAAFERLHLAAAHGVSAAVLGDDRRNLLAVLLVGGGVRDLDLGNHVSGHGLPSRATAWRRGRARRTRR